MQAQDSQYWILNENKKPLYENDNGLVEFIPTGILKPDGDPAHLEYSPEGWKGVIIKYARNIKNLGMIRDFTVPLDFVRDGAKIIKDTMWRRGMDAVLYLAIWKLNRTAFPDAYEHEYTGELDLSKIIQKDDRVNVSVTEGGLSKLFKANENTTYELDIHNDPEKQYLYFDGFPFTNKITYTVFDGQLVKDNGVENRALIAMGIIAQDGTTQGVINQDSNYYVGFPPNTNDDWFMKSFDKTITAKIRGFISFYVEENISGSTSPVNALIKKLTRNPDGSYSSTDYSIVSATLNENTEYNYPVSFDIPIIAGDQLYLQGLATVPTAAFTFKKSEITVEYEVTFNPSYAECLRPKRVFKLLQEQIAPGHDVKSDFLDSLDDSLMLTSGEAIRKFGAPAKFKTSISDFFQSFRRYGIGLSIEGNNLVIERHPYYFRSNVVYHLGVVDDVEFSVAEDLVCNTVKAGYSNVEVDKVNGRDEFNVTSQFSGPGKRVVKELDLVSVYHAGMYEIEVARIDLYGKDTTDSKVDNTCYMISVAKGVTYEYYVGDFSVIGPTTIRIPKTLTPPIIGDTLTISGAASGNGSYVIGGYAYSPGESNIGLIGAAFVGLPTLNGTISITSTTSYRLNRPAYTSVSGLLHPNEAFNIPLSPKDAIRNNGSYLRSILDFNDFNELKFTSGDRNSELSTVLAGVTTTENANEPIGGLGPQLFKPYYVKFKTKVPINLPVIMKDTPYDQISFESKGVTWYAYLWDGSIQVSTNSSQEWQMLLGPNNDMSKLIMV